MSIKGNGDIMRQFNHVRLKSPKLFTDYRTVPVSHTQYHGKYAKMDDVMAIVGKNVKTHQWDVQALRVPK